MKKDLKIKLTVPTIDLVECRKFKGGYRELDASHCYDQYVSPLEDMIDRDDNYDYDNYDNDTPLDNGSDEVSDNNKTNHVDYDDSIDAKTRESINEIIGLMPPIFATLEVNIKANSIGTSGEFLPGIITLKYNEEKGVDTGAVMEEMIHQLQYQMLQSKGIDMMGDDISRSALEYQAKMIEDLIQYREGQIVDHFIEFFVENETIMDFWDKCFDDNNNFNEDFFIEHAADFYERFVDFYSSIGVDEYSKDYDDDFDWNWEMYLELLNY